MQGAEDEGKVHAGHQGPTRGEGSVLTYVTEPEFRKQRVVSQKVCKAECLFELQMYLFFSLYFP